MNGTITINGRPTNVSFDGADTLLDVLRAYGHREVKRGCEHGECGSCLILLDDKPVNSCQVYAATALDHTVITSLGLTSDGSPHPIHKAYAETAAVQCGFCTPGQVVATYALLKEHPDPTEKQIREALSGNICRCTGYVKQMDAVRLAAQRWDGGGGQTERNPEGTDRRPKEPAAADPAARAGAKPKSPADPAARADTPEPPADAPTGSERMDAK